MFRFKTVFKKLCVNNSQAFTLLEIMVSLAIIALVFVSLLRMQAGSIQAASAVQFRGVAPVLARQLLGQVELDPDSYTQAQGEFDSPYAEYAWVCSISPDLNNSLDFITDDNQDRLKKIHIQIIGPGSQMEYTAQTWRMDSDPPEE